MKKCRRNQSYSVRVKIKQGEKEKVRENRKVRY